MTDSDPSGTVMICKTDSATPQVKENPCAGSCLYGACIASICAVKSSIDLALLVRKILKIEPNKGLPNNIRNILKKQDPFTSAGECCKATRNSTVTSVRNIRSQGDLIAFICSEFKKNKDDYAGFCVSITPVDDPGCEKCCARFARLKGYSSEHRWFTKCTEYCAAKPTEALR